MAKTKRTTVLAPGSMGTNEQIAKKLARQHAPLTGGLKQVIVETEETCAIPLGSMAPSARKKANQESAASRALTPNVASCSAGAEVQVGRHGTPCTDRADETACRE